ncbi:MAG: zf-HC2 domain-containing protein [Bryocella sp.]
MSDQPLPATCASVREQFSDYLDGTIPGVTMTTIARHLDACEPCAQDFASLRAVGQSLASLSPVKPPPYLQQQLRRIIAFEHQRGTHLSPSGKLRMAWHDWLGSATLRVSGGAVAALLLVAGLGWMFAAPLASVQANDDLQANLVAPRFLYSQVPASPVVNDRDTVVMVAAKIDSEGRVYDYSILAGPNDAAIRLGVERNLLASVFKPATIFGTPVRGQVIVTYTGVSVHG